MKRYNYLHGPFLSFFYKPFYQDVGRNWKGTGLLYMAIMLAVFWIPTVLSLYVSFGKFADSESSDFLRQIPAITIKNGQVSTDVPEPYFIKEKDGTVLAIIDTTGQYTSLDDTDAKILLTKNKLIGRDNTGLRVYDLRPVQDFYMDRARVQGWLLTIKQWFIPAFYPLALIFSFAFRTIQILIYALIGMAFASMLKVRLGYTALMRLAAISITPVLVLDLIFEFLPVKPPLWNVLGIVLALGCLVFGIKSNETEYAAPAYEPPAPSTPPI
jgi:hypothetical protein